MDKDFIRDKMNGIDEILLNDEALTRYIESVDKKIQIGPSVSKKLEEKIYSKTYKSKQKHSSGDILKVACFTLCVVLGWQLIGNIPESYNKNTDTKEKSEIEIVTKFGSMFEKFSNNMMNYERKGE